MLFWCDLKFEKEEIKDCQEAGSSVKRSMTRFTLCVTGADWQLSLVVLNRPITRRWAELVFTASANKDTPLYFNRQVIFTSLIFSVV